MAETPEEACPRAGISSCFRKGDTRSLAQGHRSGTVGCSSCVQRSESPRAAPGWGSSMTQPACKIPIFPIVWTSQWPRTPLPAAARPLHRRQGGTWQAAKSGLELPRRQADRQPGLGGRSPRAALPGACGRARSSPGLGSAPCPRPAPPTSRRGQQLPKPWVCTDPGSPAPPKPHSPRIPFPKHGLGSRCHSSPALAAPGVGGQSWAPRAKP